MPAQPGEIDLQGGEYAGPAPGPDVSHHRPAPGPRHRRAGRTRAKRPGTWPARTWSATCLLVVQGNDHPALFSSFELDSADIAWISGSPPSLPLRCTAKVRYRQPDQPCTVTRSGDRYRIAFHEPQRAVTPGQSVVFYRDDECLGGGVIETTSAARGSPHDCTCAIRPSPWPAWPRRRAWSTRCPAPAAIPRNSSIAPSSSLFQFRYGAGGRHFRRPDRGAPGPAESCALLANEREPEHRDALRYLSASSIWSAISPRQ